MFHMSSFWEKFFYLLTYIAQGASFLNPRSYSVMHQRHHAHSDTHKDPHSPTNHGNVVSMMIATYNEYKGLLAQSDFEKFKKELKDDSIIHHYPTWPWLDKLAASHWNIILWAAIYLFLYLWFQVEPLYYLLIPIHLFIGPIQGAIVNWCGHNYGHRNYEIKDHSRNTLLWDIPLMGELYQNNHHYSCQKINFAHKWYEFDPTYLIIKFMSYIRVIKIKRSCL